jgi:glutaminase-like protein
MPDTTIVGPLEAVTDALGRPITFGVPVDGLRELVAVVNVAGHKQRVTLDLTQPNGDVFRRMLLELQPYTLPVYLECDDRHAIVNVGVPNAVRVRAMRALPSGDVAVSLWPLATRRVLRRDSPRFRESLMTLANALASRTTILITTRCNDFAILHVVAAPVSADPFRGFDRRPPSCLLTEPDLLKLVTVVDLEAATQLFCAMCALACNPVDVDDSCTPFTYVMDGCDARAHEMCLQMKRMNVVTAKVWLVASTLLTPYSPNIPDDCAAEWDFHVAPVVRVTTARREEWRVIDPSLYEGAEPLPTIEEWKARQRDHGATYTIREAGLLHNDQAPDDGPNVCDPDFDLAQRVLAPYRACLICQVRRYGPPPYCK